MKGIEVLYKDTEIKIIEDETGKWMAATGVARSLKYKNPAVAINTFLETNKELLIGNIRQLRILKTGPRQGQWYFNLDAIILFLMKSNMPGAIPFQAWAKTVLSNEIKKIPAKKESALRLKSRKARCEFTDTLQEHGVTKKHEYIQLTYQTKTSIGIDRDKKKCDCDPRELCQIMISEILSTYEIENDNANGYQEIKPIVQTSGEIVSQIPLSKINKQIEAVEG